MGQYIHAGGKLGVLVEVNCETDFVARTDEFQELVRDLAMQVAASNPLFVRRGRGGFRRRSIGKKRSTETRRWQRGKPERIVERIVEGRMEKYYTAVCLYEQPFVKDPSITVEQLIKSKIATLKENITARRFCRFKVGEDL